MKKITNKIIALTLGVPLLMGIVLGTVFINILYQTSNSNLEYLKGVLNENFDLNAKNEIETVVSLIKQIHSLQQKGIYSEPEAKKLAADLIRELTYSKDSYFWIDTKEGDNVVYMGKEEEGKNRIDAIDKKGNYFIKEIIDNAVAGGGYTEYWFPRGNGKEPLPKRSYSEYYEPYNWVIGTGNYIDDIDKLLAEKAEEQSANMFKSIFSTIGIITLALVIGSMVAIIIGRRIANPIVILSKKVEEISKGNLSVNIELKQKDEIGILSNSLRNMVIKLREIVHTIITGTTEIATASKEISTISEQIAQGAAQQASSTEEVSASMEEMLASIQQNSDNAMETGKIAMLAAKDIEMVSESFSKTFKAMQVITAKILIINELADKTDLLAVNAAIEAARAGESGKGFAVVADEVRKLAEESMRAAKEIDDLSTSSIEITRQSEELLRKVVPNIQRTSNLVQEISSASMEQNAGTSQVNDAIQQLALVTQSNSAAAEQMSTGSDELASQAEALKHSIEFFSISGRTKNKALDYLKKQNEMLMNAIAMIEKDELSPDEIREIKVPAFHKSSKKNSKTEGVKINLDQDEEQTETDFVGY